MFRENSAEDGEPLTDRRGQGRAGEGPGPPLESHRQAESESDHPGRLKPGLELLARPSLECRRQAESEVRRTAEAGTSASMSSAPPRARVFRSRPGACPDVAPAGSGRAGGLDGRYSAEP